MPIHCDLPTPPFSIASYDNNPELDPALFTELSGSPEIVLLVAPAASGKSTLAKQFVIHVRVNSDDMGNLEKCFQLATEMVVEGR